jgi:hypothetical protein
MECFNFCVCLLFHFHFPSKLNSMYRSRIGNSICSIIKVLTTWTTDFCCLVSQKKKIPPFMSYTYQLSPTGLYPETTNCRPHTHYQCLRPYVFWNDLGRHMEDMRERVKALLSWNTHLTRTELKGFSCVILKIWLIQRFYGYKGNPGGEIHLLYGELLVQKEITTS